MCTHVNSYNPVKLSHKLIIHLKFEAAPSLTAYNAESWIELSPSVPPFAKMSCFAMAPDRRAAALTTAGQCYGMAWSDCDATGLVPDSALAANWQEIWLNKRNTKTEKKMLKPTAAFGCLSDPKSRPSLFWTLKMRQSSKFG